MSSIYSSGSVAINNGSNIVSGTGTQFSSVAEARLGDLFTFDGLKFYEMF